MFFFVGLFGYSMFGLVIGIDCVEINWMVIMILVFVIINFLIDQMVFVCVMFVVVEMFFVIFVFVFVFMFEFLFEMFDVVVFVQDVVNVSDEVVNCFVGVIYFEFKGELFFGQFVVVEVIFNCVQFGCYFSDVCDVVIQCGQFSFVCGGCIFVISMSKIYCIVFVVVKVVFVDVWQSVVFKVMFFNMFDCCFGGCLIKIVSIGNYVFYC